MNIFSELASATAAFDSFGVFNEFMVRPSQHSTQSTMINYILKRVLLADDPQNDNDESFSEERLYNDAMRSMRFITIFSLFSVIFCSLSFYIYNRPFDGPNGNSIVSKIRKLPFFGWFFRQPQYAAQTQTHTSENVGLMDDNDDNNNENDIELGDTETQNTPSLHSAPQPATTEGKTDATINNTTNTTTTIDVNPPSTEIVSSSSASAIAGTPVGSDNNNSNDEETGDTKQYKAPLLFGNANVTLGICAVGLLVSYLTWGFMQERIMSHPYGDPEDESNWFKSSEFCVLINRFFGLTVSTIALRFSTRSGKDAPPFVISLCALSNMSSSWFQYESLHFVSFPVQTIFKSSKILITMFVGKVVQKKTFPLRKYFTAVTVAIGVYIFLDGQRSAEDSEESDASSVGIYFYLGLALISGYAFCDAFTSNWQSRVFDQTKISSLEMMQVVNAFTFVVSLCFCVSDLFNIFEFYVLHPPIIIHSLIMGVTAGVGQTIIFYTIQNFGAVLFATVMTTRMVISVLISIWWYQHPLSTQGMVGMLVTFCALFYQVYDKSVSKKKGGKK